MATAARDTVRSAVRLVEPTRAADPYREMDMLRFSTAGSVDDGKSTLIGRLLYDTKSILKDQLDAIQSASRRRGEDYVNLALLTDGLRAEREQNITIDVAYRYFATPRRKFIIADTPGHVQYTRNMVTGASTVDLAIVLIDARKGLLEQSKRHAYISALLEIQHLVLAVNKMDLVDYDEDVFQRIVNDFSEFAAKLGVKDVISIPVSALHGDNVVERSAHMTWYQGGTLLHHLETVNVTVDANLLDFRFPVQYVIRPHQDFRGFAGKVVSGSISAGEPVLVMPSGVASRVQAVRDARGAVPEAVAGDCVVVTLADDIDVGRGDIIVRSDNVPAVTTNVDAVLCWMSEAPLRNDIAYMFMQNTRTVRAFVTRVVHRIDIDTLETVADAQLGLNDIGRVEITTADPVCVDAYRENKATGSFILIDPHSNVTVGAGIIRRTEPVAVPLPDPAADTPGPRVSPGVTWEGWNLPRAEREARNGHKAAVIWLTGVPASGKTTLARELERELFARGCQTMLLDGDQLRHGLNGDLGFSFAERRENIRRAGEVARLFFEQGSIVLCAFVSPYRAHRDAVRASLPAGRFIEVHVDCSVEECRKRDPKGLYGRASAGDVRNLTGVSATYEAPVAPELKFDTTRHTPAQVVESLLDYLVNSGIVPA